jgi:hypothetical protein
MMVFDLKDRRKPSFIHTQFNGFRRTEAKLNGEPSAITTRKEPFERLWQFLTIILIADYYGPLWKG